MSDITYSSDNLVAGQPNDVYDIKQIKLDTAGFLNSDGWIDSAKLAAGSATANVELSGEWAKAGISHGSTVRRGKSIIATEETFTQTTLGYATTPDRVQNVELPTDGLIFVLFQATWKSSATYAGTAELFLDSDAVLAADGKTAGVPQEVAATTGSVADSYQPLYSTPLGLRSFGITPSSPYSGDVTTGQFVGGMVWAPSTSSASALHQEKRYEGGGIGAIFAAAGTYDVGVKFAASSGSVTVKNRKLWVWTQAF
jgi:hypothetical protein